MLMPIKISLFALFVGQACMESVDNSSRLSVHQPEDLSFTTVAAKFNQLYNDTVSINKGFIYEYEFNHSQVSLVLTKSV